MNRRDFIPDTPTSNVVGTLPGESKDEIGFLIFNEFIEHVQNM